MRQQDLRGLLGPLRVDIVVLEQFVKVRAIALGQQGDFRDGAAGQFQYLYQVVVFKPALIITTFILIPYSGFISGSHGTTLQSE